MDWIPVALLVILVALVGGAYVGAVGYGVRAACRHPRRGVPVVGFLLALYVACSLQGRYLVANHGGMDWSESWCPRLLVERRWAPSGRPRTRWTTLGVLLAPLVLADRLLWHPGRDPWAGGELSWPDPPGPGLAPPPAPPPGATPGAPP